MKNFFKVDHHKKRQAMASEIAAIVLKSEGYNFQQKIEVLVMATDLVKNELKKVNEDTTKALGYFGN